jgi:hypothetical protein
MWHVTRVEERRDAYRILVEKPEGKRPIGRTSRRWEAFKIDLHKIKLTCALD